MEWCSFFLCFFYSFLLVLEVELRDKKKKGGRYNDSSHLFLVIFWHRYRWGRRPAAMGSSFPRHGNEEDITSLGNVSFKSSRGGEASTLAQSRSSALPLKSTKTKLALTEFVSGGWVDG